MKNLISILGLFCVLSVSSGLYAQKATPPSTSTTCDLTEEVILKVLKESTGHFGCSLEHLYDEYLLGNCCITLELKDVNGYWFKVEYGGGIDIILIETF